MTQPAQPVHSPLVTTSSKRCFQCSFSGGMPVSVARAYPRIPMAATPVVLAHQGGWDEVLFVLVPLLVFATLQWLNRRKARQERDEGGGPSAQ